MHCKKVHGRHYISVFISSIIIIMLCLDLFWTKNVGGKRFVGKIRSTRCIYYDSVGKKKKKEIIIIAPDVLCDLRFLSTHAL